MAQVEQIVTNRYLVVEKLMSLLRQRFGNDFNVTVRTLSQPSPSFEMLPPQPCENQLGHTGRAQPDDSLIG
jgi:hypothetical protein